jgi:cytochrome c5
VLNRRAIRARHAKNLRVPRTGERTRGSHCSRKSKTIVAKSARHTLCSTWIHQPGLESLRMSWKNSSGACLVILASLGNSGCEKKAAPEQTSSVDQPAEQAAPQVDSAALAAVTAKTTFNSKCIVCHGGVGLGDGPGAAALNPKPRAFADGTWQNSVSDEQISNTIIMGGAAVGKSPNMPANPELADKPEVVKQLVQIVRGFKKG